MNINNTRSGTRRSLRAHAKPCTNSWVPSPVARLADHDRPFESTSICFDQVACKASLCADTKSDLLKRKYVSGVISSRTSEGTLGRNSVKEDASLGIRRTSGSGRTHKEMSAFFILRHYRQYCCMSCEVIGKKTRASMPRWTPITSTTSVVSLKPAVSATTTGKPPMSKVSSRTSLVVPGIGVTIDACRFARGRKRYRY